MSRETEQAEAGTLNMANMAAIYFHTLIKNKLTRQEALVLTAEMVSAVFLQKPDQ
jgi:hypothetical protein